MCLIVNLHVKLLSSLIEHVYSFVQSFFYTHSNDYDDNFDGDGGDDNTNFNNFNGYFSYQLIV
jgi:hypothetical protein